MPEVPEGLVPEARRVRVSWLVGEEGNGGRLLEVELELELDMVMFGWWCCGWGGWLWS